MKTGVAAVALAASALLANTPAMAQEGPQFDRAVPGLQGRTGSDLTLRGGEFELNRQNRNNFRGDRSRRDRSRSDRRRRGDRGRQNWDNSHNAGHKKVYLNDYGQTAQQVKYLADKAIYACACQLEIDAHKYGYKDGSFRATPYYEQIGPNKFIVKGTAKLYDGYDYSRQSYDCQVKHGKIKRAANLYPVSYNGNGGHSRRSRRNNGFGFTGFSFSFGNQW